MSYCLSEPFFIESPICNIDNKAVNLFPPMNTEIFAVCAFEVEQKCLYDFSVNIIETPSAEASVQTNPVIEGYSDNAPSNEMIKQSAKARVDDGQVWTLSNV